MFIYKLNAEAGIWSWGYHLSNIESNPAREWWPKFYAMIHLNSFNCDSFSWSSFHWSGGFFQLELQQRKGETQGSNLRQIVRVGETEFGLGIVIERQVRLLLEWHFGGRIQSTELNLGCERIERMEPCAGYEQLRTEGRTVCEL